MLGRALAYNASHYTPEEAEEYVLITLTQNYVFYATSTLLVYELLVTFDEEVDRVWSLRWRLPKVLFILNRYVVRALLILQFIVGDMPGTSAGFCAIYGSWQIIPTRLAILVAQALMVIRLWAIYNNSKCMFHFLLGIYMLEVAAVVTCATLASIDTQGASQPSPLGCGLEERSSMLKNYASGTWIAPVCFELIILLLTLVKIVPLPSWISRLFNGYTFVNDRPSRNATLDILARDSLIYFTFIFTFTFTNLMLYEYSFSAFYRSILLGPTSAISCIAVSQMIINIRSLPRPLNDTAPDLVCAGDPVASMHVMSSPGLGSTGLESPVVFTFRDPERGTPYAYFPSRRASTSTHRSSASVSWETKRASALGVRRGRVTGRERESFEMEMEEKYEVDNRSGTGSLEVIADGDEVMEEVREVV
uniref:DUF6533 domain-containing protein n=1 Tax=Mycena chlorophos TaxID=658473 RepID=A0ABQ0M5I3_MYCCL|nr:predicted protein [Mycena chlorophos]